MSEELKPCPFCGCRLSLIEGKKFVRWEHLEEDCFLYGLQLIGPTDIRLWNTRTAEERTD